MRTEQYRPIQGITKRVMDSTAPTKNQPNGGLKGRAKDTLLLVVLFVAAGLQSVALGSPGSTNGTDATVPSTPPLPTPAVAQQAPAPAGTGIASAITPGPRIRFATPVHDFGKIKNGEVVKYTYAFTNIGDRLLEITGVRPSCGCTAAGDWSKKVEPGQTGVIPIQFNSGNFGGQVTKSVTVTCNDTNTPSVILQLKAMIWKAIEVSPQYAVLSVIADAPSSPAIVRIVSNEEAPLTLSAPECTNSAFVAELRTNQPGKEFQVIVNAVQPLPSGNARGVISLKTSSTNMPIINITAIANVRQAVAVMPSQITLPAGPLTNPMPYTISIRNNGTNTMTLSEPVVNARGVDVQIQELQPGHYFSLKVTFPAGTELPQGEKVELSVKSNHPQFQTIKVPVRQLVRPAPVAASAPGQVSQPPRPAAVTASAPKRVQQPPMPPAPDR